MSRLYLPTGFLNVPYIDSLADKHGISFVVLIGGRQVGKTYGTLKLMLDDDRRFILMRRTQSEADFITNQTVNPFVALGRVDISAKKDGEYTGKILQGKPEENNVIGLTMALSTVAKIRGFSGTAFSDVVFDEFIPERHVVKIKDEGAAFLNAYVTISGNRELNGEKPLKVWLIANANDISNPILQALRVGERIERMAWKGQELSILEDRSIMIVLPKSEAIQAKRKKTALVKAIGTDTDFFGMAYNNDFSYNDNTGVRYEDLTGAKPVLSIRGRFTIWNKSGYYVSKYLPGALTEYGASAEQAAQVLRRYPDIRAFALRGKFRYESLIIKEDFLNFFKVY